MKLWVELFCTPHKPSKVLSAKLANRQCQVYTHCNCLVWSRQVGRPRQDRIRLTSSSNVRGMDEKSIRPSLIYLHAHHYTSSLSFLLSSISVLYYRVLPDLRLNPIVEHKNLDCTSSLVSVRVVRRSDWVSHFEQITQTNQHADSKSRVSEQRLERRYLWCVH